jgi:hypothetical protein
MRGGERSLPASRGTSREEERKASERVRRANAQAAARAMRSGVLESSEDDVPHQTSTRHRESRPLLRSAATAVLRDHTMGRSDDDSEDGRDSAFRTCGPPHAAPRGGVEAKAEELLSPSKRRSRLSTSRQMREVHDSCHFNADSCHYKRRLNAVFRSRTRLSPRLIGMGDLTLFTAIVTPCKRCSHAALTLFSRCFRDGVITRQEFEKAVASRSFSLRGLTSSDDDM